MVLSLKSNSLWNKFLAIYPFVGGTASTHKFNLISPFDNDSSYRLTFNNFVTHNDKGAIPNGTDSFANTYLAPNAFGQNDISMWFCSTGPNNTRTSNDAFIAMGASDEGPSRYCSLNTPYSATNDNKAVLNGGNTSSPYYDNNFYRGLFGFSRILSTEFKYYVNGNVLGGSATPSTSISPNGRSIYLFAVNYMGSAVVNCPLWCGFAGIASGLDATQSANLNTIVSTYQNALGRQ
jgi:hypothetical protein